VGGRIFMVQGPGIYAPFNWMFVPDVFPQPPQNIAVEVSIHCLSWCNKFLTHDAFIWGGINTYFHCFELVLPWVMVDLASSAEMIASSFEGHIQ
jgi:hypothetical protein